MYITRLHVSGIRAISDFELTFPRERPWGWHVLLGDNGAGKSTVIRSLALALAGPSEAKALRQVWTNWLSVSRPRGTIQVNFNWEPDLDWVSGRGPHPHNDLYGQIVIEKDEIGGSTLASIKKGRSATGVDRTIWGQNKGWFSASFGPYRRFTGGNRDYERVYFANPRLASHLSAFGEDVALTESLEWLKSLHIQKLEKQDSTVDHVIDLINLGGLLPHGARVEEITSEEVFFRDGNGNKVAVDQLSDGYRSVLSMTFELLRQMTRCYPPERVFANVKKGQAIVDMPGVVAIDEVDAHLHPAWQRNIGRWMTKLFPKLQFIVSTHSPLVCRSALEGSIWQLPKPGSDERGGQVTGEIRERLILGNILEAYDTDLFGENITRSPESRDLLQRLAILNRKALKGNLSTGEQSEVERIRSTLPTTATVAERADLPVE